MSEVLRDPLGACQAALPDCSPRHDSPAGCVQSWHARSPLV